MTGGPPLVVYGRDGCHLCEALETELRASRPDLAFATVDVDDEPDLARRYGHKVPVLCAGEDEICCHYLDMEALERYLRAARA